MPPSSVPELFSRASVLADRAALLRDLNRYLRFVPVPGSPFIGSQNPVLPYNQNRVGLLVSVSPPLANLSQAANIVLGIYDLSGANLIHYIPLLLKQADVSSVTPSPFFIFSLLHLSIEQHGPLVQNPIALDYISGTCDVYLSEIVMAGVSLFPSGSPSSDAR